ncbi:hypothetical protein FNAPI_4509 [Fusarium napiforme]|uniref:Uncharacterized protein n=1 Tax=Fusarium napiforme TaxID=42672 RepID=A0A8H5NCJ6_9HYPO|nr:hypothetical protein FNAPI_4509 [Fusarium napiforme]
MPPLADLFAGGLADDESKLSPWEGITDDGGDERQTLSSRGLSDLDELTEDIVSNDIHVASFRDPASFVDTRALLTAREKDIVFVMLRPIRKTAEPPYRITCGYWNGIFKKLFDD